MLSKSFVCKRGSVRLCVFSIAKDLHKPILIYLKRCATRDPQLNDFIRTELQPSHKYQEFSTTEELVSRLPDIRRTLDAEALKHQRQAYRDALVAQTELLELAGIVDTGEQERPKLQDIYIALSAAEEVEERDERQPKHEREHERPIKITRHVPIEQALREHRNLMILGDPGSGKSTLLRYLTLVAARNTTKDEGRKTEDGGRSSSILRQELGLPILLRLSSFAQSGQSFIEYFATYAEKQLQVSLGKKFFERTLEDGQAFVCLDGLDKISQPAQRIDVRNVITAFANRYPRNRFIITSRVAGYDCALLDKRVFAHHTIVPFGEKEIQSFVEKWYAAREREIEQAKSRAANLFNDLKANERLLRLLDLFVSGEFSKEMLLERKTRLEDTLVELERTKAELNTHLQTAVLSDDQIAELEAFCAEVRTGLDNATFEDKRRYFDLLDVRGKLAVENNEKVAYLSCKIGKQRVVQMPISHLSNTGATAMRSIAFR